jgi:hypothetical protein
MAAGLGFKTFTTGEVLTAADVNGYLMQGVLVFASAAARNAAITSPQEGQFAFTKDTNGLWYYDGAAWVASGATGDIEGVTAGVGITGGGTSGTVTITNDMATTITASGDIVVGTGSGTYDNLPIGTTNQVLTADTTVSPYKVKWATPSASTPTYAGCLVYGSTDQNITNNTFTALTYDSEINDTNTYHSTSSNTSRITIPSGKAGYYQVYANASFSANASGSRQLFIRKNNTDIIFSAMGGYNNGRNVVFISGTINCAVGDYLEIFAYQESGSTLDVGGGTRNNFGVDYLGA